MAEAVVELGAVTTVVVDDYHVHPHTGHITVTVHCHTVAGKSSWDGPNKRYGCDLQRFRDQFAGNVEAFEAYVANEHRSIAGPPPGLSEALMKRKGQQIG